MDKNNYQNYDERLRCFKNMEFWNNMIKICDTEYKALIKIDNKPEMYKSTLQQAENYYNQYKLEFQRCQNIITPQ